MICCCETKLHSATNLPFLSKMLQIPAREGSPALCQSLLSNPAYHYHHQPLAAGLHYSMQSVPETGHCTVAQMQKAASEAWQLTAGGTKRALSSQKRSLNLLPAKCWHSARAFSQTGRSCSSRLLHSFAMPEQHTYAPDARRARPGPCEGGFILLRTLQQLESVAFFRPQSLEGP